MKVFLFSISPRLLAFGLLFCDQVNSEELPKEYSPLRILLGEWTGTVNLKVTTPQGTEKIRYEKRSSCAYDPNQNAIVTVDVEADPWTKKKVTTTAVIKQDQKSKRFVAMVSATDGSVRRFAIHDKHGTLHYQQLNGSPGTKFHCEVTAGANGKLFESGTHSTPTPINTTIDWKVVYTPSKPDAQQ